MRLDQIKALLQVTEARLRQQQKRALPGQTAIARLNEQRQKINHLEQTSNDPKVDPSFRTTGADVLWRAWLDRQRRDVNTELARQLAAQDAIIQDVKKAAGRHEGMGAVLRKALHADALSQARKREEELLATVLRTRSKKS